MTQTSTQASLSPWYTRTMRWGQTNITELDPTHYDIEFWREHWRRTRVQGVIINAGGIVAYYPSQIPLTYTAAFLNGRDLFGELVAAARQEGLVALARMDSNRVHEPVFSEHPDWIARDAEGKPYRAGDLYVTSVDSPYYDEYLPEALREIARRYHPDGFTDNSFSGLNREHIDYSPHSARRFREVTGHDLPRRKDWDDPVYRQWIRWSYNRRLEIWDLNNRTVQEEEGPHCLWMGMIGSDFIGQGASFRDLKGIGERAKFVMVDSQSRPTGGVVTAPGSFKYNTEGGMLLHNLAGWDTLMPESMAMYEHNGPYPFRVAAKPAPEARLWALEGFAGGIQPWWHHIGAYHEDRRQYRTAESLFQWHEANQEYLVQRQPVAPVGVVWSQENADFYGRDDARGRVDLPWQGFTRAMLRERILYQPVHADHIERDAAGLAALVLPNVGALSDQQVAAVRAFAAQGGGVIASGETSRYNEWGDLRPDFALSDILGVHALGVSHGSAVPQSAGWDEFSQHSYLRIAPELRAGVYGPRTGQEPAAQGSRHAALAGFEETDLLAFGGRLEGVRLAAGTIAPLTFVPPFPVYPPETAWIRVPATHLPGLALRELPSGGRIAYLAADLDRCYARNPLPDWSRLLGNLVRWAVGERGLPLEVQGAGLLDCRLYRQPGRFILHIVNLTATEPRPVHEFIPVGPLRIRLRLDGLQRQSARLLVAGGELSGRLEDGWLCMDLPRVVDHEVLVIE